MLGVCEEELLGSQRSGAQARTHERKERTAEKEEERRTGRRRREGGRSQWALGSPQNLGLLLLVRWF